LGGIVRDSLAHILADIDDVLTESNGEITPEVEARFKDLVSKVDRCALFLDYAKSRTEFLKAKADEFKKAAEATEKIGTGFRTYLQICLINSGQDSLQGESFVITTRKNAPAMILEDISSIPPQFFETKSETVLKKSELKDALKLGAIPGARLESSTSIVCKPRRV